MTSFSCMSGRLHAVSQENGRLFFSGRNWSKVVPFIQGIVCRGVKTAVPEELSPSEDEDSSYGEIIKTTRDVSRLRPEHRNMANRMVPSEEKKLPHHFTVLYNKRMFGRYGYASGVNPSICWPSKQELADKQEYESVAYPYTIMEVRERELAKERKEEQEKFERDAQVAENYKKMLTLKKEFLKRQEKQKTEAEAAKAFKTRLIEEVRLHFNYTINERDERFKLEVRERAKQLREKEKLEKKTLKKEKQAVDKVNKFEIEKQRLKAEEEKKSALNKL